MGSTMIPGYPKRPQLREMIVWLVVEPYPSEKWWSESQLGWWHSQLFLESHKIHVPNHQPVIIIHEVSWSFGGTQTTCKGCGTKRRYRRSVFIRTGTFVTNKNYPGSAVRTQQDPQVSFKTSQAKICTNRLSCEKRPKQWVPKKSLTS